MDAAITGLLLDYFSQYPTRIYPKGQIILFADEVPAFVFFIARGSVRQYEVSYRGDETVIYILRKFASFPASWAITQTPNKYFFKAETETKVHVIPPLAYLQFLRENPSIVLYLLGQLHRHLDETDGRMIHLMIGTARSRLMYELVIACRNNTVPEVNGSRILRIKEVELAARSGLSRETVSRELKRLREREWIDTSNGVIVIKDLEHLEQALQSSTVY